MKRYLNEIRCLQPAKALFARVPSPVEGFLGNSDWLTIRQSSFLLAGNDIALGIRIAINHWIIASWLNDDVISNIFILVHNFYLISTSGSVRAYVSPLVSSWFQLLSNQKSFELSNSFLCVDQTSY